MSPHNEKLVRDIVAVAKVNAAMNIPLVLVLSLMQRRCSSADIGPKERTGSAGVQDYIAEKSHGCILPHDGCKLYR